MNVHKKELKALWSINIKSRRQDRLIWGKIQKNLNKQGMSNLLQGQVLTSFERKTEGKHLPY